MPVQLSVQVRNATLVEKRFEDFTKEVPQIGAGRLRGRLESAKTFIARYPPLWAGGRPGGWRSDKQRRYVLWAIRQGIIKVPYQRTGYYGSHWIIDKIDNGYRLRFTGPSKYRWVSGGARGEDQARIHQGRWAHIRAATEQAVNGLPKEIQDNIIMVARRRGM